MKLTKISTCAIIRKAGNSAIIFDWGGIKMNIYKRTDEGLFFSNFSQEECETIIDILRCMQSLCNCEKSKIVKSAEHTILVHKFDIGKISLNMSCVDGVTCFYVLINLTTVFEVYAEPVHAEICDYVVWSFRSGSWIETIKEFATKCGEKTEYDDAFKPFLDPDDLE